MEKKVIVISASRRTKSNSNLLAESLIKGAVEGGNDVEKISLAEKKLDFCKGCLVCQKTGTCIIKDDANEIADKMLNADVIVFATPVYYYSISGQLKTLMDRVNQLYSKDYKFREVYLLATAAENLEKTFSGTKTAIQGWTDCMDKADFKSSICIGNMNDGGDIENHPALKQAFELGRTL